MMLKARSQSDLTNRTTRRNKIKYRDENFNDRAKTRRCCVNLQCTMQSIHLQTRMTLVECKATECRTVLYYTKFKYRDAREKIRQDFALLALKFI